MALGGTSTAVEDDADADVRRTAFTLAQVYERRDGLRITAVALDHAGDRVFLGLVNGQLEEHRLLRSPAGPPGCRFSAEKRVFRRPIADICCLPHVQRLALLSGDGGVALCSLESFDVLSLVGVKNATGLAADAAVRYPERLAVAVRSPKRSKVLVFGVVAAGASAGAAAAAPVQLLATVPVPSPIQGMAWVGRHIFLAVSGGYLLVSAEGGVVVLAQQLTCPTMLAPVPDAALAVLMFEETMALVTDDKGTGVREPLLLPSRPLALANSGFYLLAVGDEGIHVFDRDSSRQVQFIDFQHDDAWVATSRRIACASDLTGRCVVLATSSGVWCLEPVPSEQQVRELLKRRRYNQAIQLAEMCQKQGATWVEAAWAQAGLLLLQDLKFEAAVRVLVRCGPAAFQPAELLPLFPAYIASWLPQAPVNPHWGLHGVLHDLRRMLQDRLELMDATSYQPAALQQPGPHASRASTPEAIEQLEAEAKVQLVHYLLQVRHREGVELLEGVDSLAVRLLCDTGDASALEAFVAGDSRAHAEEAAGALKAAGRWHALALMWSSHGRSKEAVDIWQRLGQGKLVEAPCSSGAVAAATGGAAEVAVECAALDMMRPGRLGAEDVMAFLPWLLQQSPPRALDVLKARDELPVLSVLALLGGPALLDLRWRFLHHTVYQRSSQDAGLHTELAMVLVDAVRAAAASAAEPAASSLPATAEEPPSAVHRLSAPRTSSSEISPAPVTPTATTTSSVASRSPSTTFFGAALPLTSTPTSLLRSGSGMVQGLAPAVSRAGSLAAGSLARLSSSGRSFSAAAAATAAADARGEAGLRAVLQSHLQQSSLYDAQLVLQVVKGTSLWQEQVLLHSRLLNHGAALRILALTLHDVDAALAYCARLGSQDAFMDLLELFLRPGDGYSPMYPAAVRVLNAEGANLNPLKVLQSLSDDMPLHLAVDTLARMVAGSTHRTRQLAVTRNLHRAQNLNVRVERAEMHSQRAAVTEETTCRGCKRLLGSKVFYRYPSGVILCSRCAKPNDSSQ